jgi:hypothetical protein
MATVSKEFLSGSTNGQPVKVAASSTPGTTIHTAHATAKDEIYVFCYNSDSVDRKLTLEKGGTTSPDNHQAMTIPAGETVLVMAGTPLSNSLVLKAFGAAANVLVIDGYVNRIS